MGQITIPPQGAGAVRSHVGEPEMSGFKHKAIVMLAAAAFTGSDCRLLFSDLLGTSTRC